MYRSGWLRACAEVLRDGMVNRQVVMSHKLQVIFTSWSKYVMKSTQVLDGVVHAPCLCSVMGKPAERVYFSFLLILLMGCLIIYFSCGKIFGGSCVAMGRGSNGS